MKAVRYLLVPWTGVAVYALLALHSGPVGSASYRQLLAGRESAEANLERLKAVNQELERAKDALLYDADTLAVRARELGYARPGEKFLRVVGLADPYRRRPAPGEVYAAPARKFIPGPTLLLIALASSAVVFLALALFDFLVFLRR
ncbi:MAG: putative septum formation initiator subfamily [Treponematales bacterium]